MEFLLHQLLEKAAATHADQIAVVDRERTVTYAELEKSANSLAHVLMARGVAAGDRVGLYLEKSAEAIEAIFAVLKAGAVYVPLDPQAPIARVAYVARNCQIKWLLTGTEQAGAWTELIAQAPQIEGLIVLNSFDVAHEGVRGDRVVLDRRAVDAASDSRPSVSRIGFDLAYILYTSGSTGNPKGVMLTHRNALTFVEWAVDEYGVTASDRLSNHAPLHFDLTIFDIFAAAKAGATLVLVPQTISVFPVEIARFIERTGITVWYSVPSLLSRLSESAILRQGSLPRLRTILFAGEVFPVKYLRKLMLQLPHVRFSNLYGPTETNVCTWYDVTTPPDELEPPIPIGRAIGDVEVFAVKDDGSRAEPGEVGELLVRGPTVMQGYWGDPERTARGLVPDPYGRPHHVYRTGDLVREDASGSFRLIGRRDAQIKSRGYRIELGEIEAALYRHPAVAECAAIAVPDEMITNRLVAIVGVRSPVTEASLRQWCAEIIPRYMIPESIRIHDTLPKTSTGKIDRQALSRAYTERMPAAAGGNKEAS